MSATMLPAKAPVLDPMDPGEECDIQHDYALTIAGAEALSPGDTIVTIVGLTVTPATVPPLVATVASIQPSKSSGGAALGVTTRMEGGVAFTLYAVTATVLTALGCRLPRSVILPVQQR